MSDKTHVLRNTATASYEYDPEAALRLYSMLQPFITEDGYRDGDWMSDDARIISLFELLAESQFGDMIFTGLADDDQGSELFVRDSDGELTPAG